MLASIVVLYVASADVDATTTATIVRALDQALGAPTQVSVRPIGPPPSDGQLAQTCGEPQVGGVAVVSWASHERRAATVLVRHCGSGGEDGEMEAHRSEVLVVSRRRSAPAERTLAAVPGRDPRCARSVELILSAT